MSIQEQTYTRLVVNELQTTIEQSLTVSSRTYVERILPHLYIQGSPTGTVTLRVKKGSTVAAEATLDLTDAIARAGKTKNHYHGYMSFQFPKPPILKPDTYTLELEADTYSFGSDFIGWVKIPSAADQTSILEYPHDLRIVEIRAP